MYSAKFIRNSAEFYQKIIKKGIATMKILLIAGHGAGDSGACGNGYQEANLTREVATLLADKLKGMCDVQVADTSRNWFEYLKSHSFNFMDYDYVLEIHFNSGGGTGTEIFVTTSEQGVGVESAIVRHISEEVGYYNRGVKRTNYSVISKVKAQDVSAALLEVAFIDNERDMAIYTNSKDKIVTAIAAGIAEGFGLSQRLPEHWARGVHKRLESLGYVTDYVWGNYDADLPVGHALALLDNISGGRWRSDEADSSIHWAQPIVISLCGKGWITDKEQFISLLQQNANLSIALCLALVDKATGGMRDAYKNRKTDHWARNCLDSLCDKGIITTPTAWTNFEGAVTYGLFMALVCGAFRI